MISRIEGGLVAAHDGIAIVQVGGVGFQLHVPQRTLDQLPPAGQTVRFETYLHVREDALQLFGFADTVDRDLFTTLLSVSNVGPNLALSVLSTLSVEAFCVAILAGDERALTRVPGVGPKVAKRLVFELAERIRKLESTGTLKRPEVGGQPAADAVSALVALGCRPVVAERAVRRALEELPDLSDPGELVREALKRRSVQG